MDGETILTARASRGPRIVTRPRARALAPWLAAGFTMFPVAVLSHELGHWGVARAVGVGGIRLHYGSTSDATLATFWQLVDQRHLDAAAAVLPLWKPPAIALGGLVVTYTTAALCYWYTTRRRVNPYVVALGMISVFRFVGGVPLILLRWFYPTASADETHAALNTTIPSVMLLALGFVLLWLLWWRMPRALPREERGPRIASLVTGAVAGAALYLGVLGPRFLP